MRFRRNIWKSQVRTNRSTKGFVSLAVRDIFGSYTKEHERGERGRFESRRALCKSC
jgi:hypothetical protein